MEIWRLIENDYKQIIGNGMKTRVKIDLLPGITYMLAPKYTVTSGSDDRNSIHNN